MADVVTVEYETGITRADIPYDTELIERLKDAIDVPHRRWNPVTKTWDFSPTVWPKAREIIEEYYPIED